MISEDEQWPITLQYWHSLMGAEGIASIVSSLMDTLPTPTEAKKLPEAVQRLKALKQSGLCKLVNEDTHILVKEALEACEAMDKGDAPTMKESPIQQLTNIYSALPNFLRKSSSADAGVVLVGIAAYADMMTTLDAVTAPAGLQELVQWSWLANASDQALLSKKRDELIAQVMEANKLKKSAAAASSASSAGPTNTPVIPEAKAKGQNRRATPKADIAKLLKSQTGEPGSAID